MDKRETVYLSQLEGVQILWPGDVRALAEFVLRCYDAKDRAVDSSQSTSRMESRPTVHGLAGHFAGIGRRGRVFIIHYCIADPAGVD